MTQAVLQRLLEATPLPPDSDDPTELLAAYEALAARGHAIMHEVPTAPIAATDEDRALICEIAARQDAWRAAIAIARGAHRTGSAALAGRAATR